MPSYTRPIPCKSCLNLYTACTAAILTDEYAWCTLRQFAIEQNPLENDQKVEITKHSDEKENHWNELKHDWQQVTEVAANMHSSHIQYLTKTTSVQQTILTTFQLVFVTDRQAHLTVYRQRPSFSGRHYSCLEQSAETCHLHTFCGSISKLFYISYHNHLGWYSTCTVAVKLVASDTYWYYDRLCLLTCLFNYLLNVC